MENYSTIGFSESAGLANLFDGCCDDPEDQLADIPSELREGKLAFATIEVELNNSDQTKTNVDLHFSQEIGGEDRQKLIDDQCEDLIDRFKTGSGRFLPKCWSKTSRRWKDVTVATDATPCNRDAADSCILLANFARLAPRQYGFLIASVSGSGSDEKLSIFHSHSLRIFEKVSKPGGQGRRSVLSRSERNCLIWNARGKTSGEIATILSLSEHTVNHYFSIAASKLSATNRTHAVMKAIQHGFISLDDIV